jgi:hypothetical protein
MERVKVELDPMRCIDSIAFRRRFDATKMNRHQHVW